MLKKSTSIICKQCKIGWPIRDSDLFCGNCGAKVADYDLAIVGGPAYTDELNNAYLRLSLSNKGSLPVKIRIQPKAPWLTLEEIGSLVIPVGNSPHEVGITIDSSNPLTRAPRGLRGRIEVQEENVHQKKDIMVEICPPPAFGFAKDEITFGYSKSGREVSVELNVLVQKSTVIFDDIQPENCKDWIHIPQPSELGEPLKTGHNLVITALIDLQKMPTKNEREVSFSFKLRGRQKDETKSFKLVPLLAPELQINEAVGDGRIQITATKDKKQDFQLHLRNTGGGEIDLTKLDCQPCPDWLKLSPSQQILKKDEEATLTISVDGNVAPEGENSFELIHPEKDKIFEFPFFLGLTVRALPTYPHYLAVDFGTTYSCCVFINQRHEPEQIILYKYPDPVMGVVEDKVIPSTIFYTEENNGELKCLVGREANIELAVGRAADNYFRSIKRFIGSDEDFYITIDNKRIPLKPYQIATEIIRHLLEKAEEQLEHKITRCVIAHPTKFSQREADELRRIYTDKLGIKDIIMLDEATAASLDYIFKRNKENKGKPETYYIVVYDFGGGTTDIALLLVNAKKGSLRIEPLDVGGHRELGGDDITERIVEHMLKEYKERLQAKHPGVSIEIPFCSIKSRYKSSGDGAYDGQVRLLNRNNLYNQAEWIKIELSNKMTEAIQKVGKQISDKVDALGLQVSIGGELKKIEELLQDELEITIEYSLIEEWLSPKLDDMLDQIEGMLKNTEEHPKVILLAGQSSAIPLVKQKMEERFNEATVVSAEPFLKECVALGSSRYGRIVIHQAKDGRLDPIEVVEFTSKTHSAYGIATINEFFEEEFQTVIPKRARIPSESCGTFRVRLRNHAVVPVYENTGVKTLLEGNEEIQFVGSYIPEKKIPEAELQEVEFKMSMDRDEQIHVVANLNGKSYEFIRQEDRL